jgi:hypothetical protein
MKHALRGPVLIALLTGIGGLARFSPGVRSLAVVGLFASGMAFGAGLVRLVLGLRGKLVDDRR